MSYRTTDYEQIQAGLEIVEDWYSKTVGKGITGTRLARLKDYIDQLVTDRQCLEPASFVRKWDNPSTYYALSDAEAWIGIQGALSGIDPRVLPRRSLTRALIGELVPADDDPNASEGRNIFTELEIAAYLLRNNVEVTGFDDVAFRFDSVEYRVQCKRPFSARGVAANLTRASEQLARSFAASAHVRGVIAIAVDKVLGHDQGVKVFVDGENDVTQISQSAAAEFLRDHAHHLPLLHHPRLVALFVVVRLLCVTVTTSTFGYLYTLAIRPLLPGTTRDTLRLHQFAEMFA